MSHFPSYFLLVNETFFDLLCLAGLSALGGGRLHPLGDKKKSGSLTVTLPLCSLSDLNPLFLTLTL